MRAYYILLLYITGGNAGLAAAYSAKKLSIPITVVVPENTQDFMVVKIATEADFVTVRGKVSSMNYITQIFYRIRIIANVTTKQYM